MELFSQLKTRGVEVIDRQQVTSTNTLVKDILAKQQRTRPILMVADEQTAGHGKFDRQFYSAPNSGAYFSVGLPMSALPAGWTPQQLTVRAAVAAYQVASQTFHCPLTIKWVNDLYRGDRKVTGILAETALDQHNQLCGIVVGWGIDLTVPDDLPAELRDRAGAISDDPVTTKQRKTLVDALGARFIDLLTTPWTEVLQVYQDHQYLRGKNLMVQIGSQKTLGQFKQITGDGYLQIQTANGLKTFSAGTVRVQ
ncbi:biotin--[acetyl-CoA-carboxylase] ligase [Limosilactobacillus sp.]|uniref:biotin--[acetyl-CoA-carboxylase] ligase n=1 Tax=Limosilactobacillus sp. TaxID=2773925 RepID=UPI00345EBCB8